MRFEIKSRGAAPDLADLRFDATDELAFALAVFGAEATLRHVDGDGTVTLYEGGREILSFNRGRLAVFGGTYSHGRSRSRRAKMRL